MPPLNDLYNWSNNFHALVLKEDLTSKEGRWSFQLFLRLTGFIDDHDEFLNW